MPEIMDFILPIVSVLEYWAVVLGTCPQHPLAKRPQILGHLGLKKL